MWQIWQSNHAIHHYQKPHDTRKPHGYIFYRTGVTGEWSFTLWEREFSTFLLLRPWPSPDHLHIRTWPVFPGDIPDVQIWTSYVKAFKSHHLTDIQTRPKLYTTPLRGQSKLKTHVQSQCTTDKRCYCNRSKSADTNDTHVNKEVLKQIPHVRTRVDFFDFNLSVDVAVTQEVHIHRLHLTYTSCEHYINEHINKRDQHLIICC